MYSILGHNVERLISNNVDMPFCRIAITLSEYRINHYGECIMEIKKLHFTVFLIAVILLASGITALGAEYPVGSGNDDWWTTYPDQSSGAGEDVNHPSWVMDALQEKPVLIYVHKSCDYCLPQTNDVKNITGEFGSSITFFEISAEGTDSRAEEALQAYDPNGGTMYVPLTVIVSLATDSEGEVVPVWHSSEEITGETWIRSYVEDALTQYDEFSSGWTP